METTDEAFINQFKGLVPAVAHQLVAQLRLNCEMADLEGFGYTGLIEARHRYDPQRGIPFKVFARYRVRGAMIDGIRKMAYLPRRAYARLRAIEVLDQEAEQLALSRAAAPAGSRPAGGASAARTLDRVLGRVAAAYTVSTAVAIEHAAGDGKTPEVVLARKERAATVRAAIERLPEPERRLITGHYLEGRPLGDVAVALGWSRSWGSRAHARALSLLRELLSGQL